MATIMNPLPDQVQTLKEKIFSHYLADEEEVIRQFITEIKPDPEEQQAITAICVELIERIRAHPDFNKGLDAFMAEYSLDTIEGVRLMTLAEALARIPDEETKEALIRSKLKGADWANHVGKSLSTFVNSSTRALLFTSSVLSTDMPFLKDIIRKVGEPAIRIALELGMGIFGQQFVLGEDLDDVKEFVDRDKDTYRYSFDMLGEAALTEEDSEAFYQAYQQAIQFAGQHSNAAISIKLSALHPRFDALQKDRVKNELFPHILTLCQQAKALGVQVTIDAEEADRLELTLELLEMLLAEGSCKGWNKLGIVVQTYMPRCRDVLEYLSALSHFYDEKLYVRLVKGAYWDAEIKHAQQLGISDYPVFTRKVYSDVAYLACGKWLLEQDTLYPQFATHNAHSVATLLHWTEGKDASFEFQRLHGMGAPLYDAVKQAFPKAECCIYAPIGRQKELLPYLIRRMLENSANSSFVNQLASSTPARELSRHPADVAATPHTPLSRPPALFAEERKNSSGLNPHAELHARILADQLRPYHKNLWRAWPSIKGSGLEVREVFSPANLSLKIGEVQDADQACLDKAIREAKVAHSQWSKTTPEQRSAILEKLADLLETHQGELLTLMAKEAGKILQDGIGEVREAVDFCRYYAAQIRSVSRDVILPGPVGELNTLSYRPRGVIACISPWNFPVAIYTGQIAAALVTGNAVIAKPAEQTSLTGYRVYQLFLEAGVPAGVLQFIPGDGELLGPMLTSHPDIDGIVFTGSVEVGHIINRKLANRPGPIIPLIAETGGQNVMIVDSSALPEQVVKDTLYSAFNSAGQRCSAMRVLYLQDSCADMIIPLLKGALEQQMIGNPLNLSTDIGPVIDAEARLRLESHLEYLEKNATLLADHSGTHRSLVDLDSGHFLTPSIWQINAIGDLPEEHFGPILHVIRYKPNDLPGIFDEINALGYGLTLGVHSRNEILIDSVEAGIHAGNIYVNRNMIGAIVGSQPFGGMGLSGTGPKAGGPQYLLKFMHEKSKSVNTAAVGGAIDLINQQTAN